MPPTIEQQAKTAADDFRRHHHLGTQPLGDLVTVIEQTTGHDVAILDAEPDEHGLTMRDPARTAVFIGVARSRNPMRQRSSLGHELGHLIFDEWADDNVVAARSPEEIRADAFARHLLIPVEGLQDFLGSRETVTESELADVVQRFLVSPQLAAIVMRDSGYITPQTSETWKSIRTPQLATRFGWRDQYEALQNDSDQLRAPQSLITRAVRGYAEGVISAQVIATLRSVSLDTAKAELADAGITQTTYEAVELSADSLPNVDVDLSSLEDESSSS